MSGSPQHLAGTNSSKDGPDRDAVPGLQIITCFPYTGRGKGRRERGLILCAENGLYSPSLKQSPQPGVACSGSPGHPIGSSEELSAGAPHGAPPCQLKPSTGTTGHCDRQGHPETGSRSPLRMPSSLSLSQVHMRGLVTCWAPRIREAALPIKTYSTAAAQAGNSSVFWGTGMHKHPNFIYPKNCLPSLELPGWRIFRVPDKDDALFQKDSTQDFPLRQKNPEAHSQPPGKSLAEDLTEILSERTSNWRSPEMASIAPPRSKKSESAHSGFFSGGLLVLHRALFVQGVPSELLMVFSAGHPQFTLVSLG